MRVLQLHNLQGRGSAPDSAVHEVGALEVLLHEGDLLRSVGHDVETYTFPAAEDLGVSAARLGVMAIWNLAACREVGQLASRFRPDVAHVHTPFPVLSPAVFRTLHQQGVPTVATLHSYRYSCIAGTCFRAGAPCEACVGRRFKSPGVRYRCYHDGLGASAALTVGLTLHRGIGTFRRDVDRFIALTSFSERLLVRDGIPSDRIVVKANSVPDPRPQMRTAEPEPYVAFAGRLVDIKGIDLLLDAWRIADANGLRLVVAGDGPLRARVEHGCTKSPAMQYVGWLDSAGVDRLLAGATCTVVPSLWYEGGVPLTLLRSLAVGTPVIASDVDNVREGIVDGVTGLTFRSGNTASLAQALSRVATHQCDFSAMREAARGSYVERFSPTANLDRLLAIYRSATVDHRQCRRHPA